MTGFSLARMSRFMQTDARENEGGRREGWYGQRSGWSSGATFQIIWRDDIGGIGIEV